jgi:precorrin-3B methylase
MQVVNITQVKKLKEKYIKLRADSETVYVINHFDRSSQKYSVSPTDDMNAEKFVNKSSLVFIGFTY